MTRAPISTDVEYVGLAPGLSNGVGVAITTFRPVKQSGWGVINVNIKRAALERIRDDIESVLASSEFLNSEATLRDAEQGRVEVAKEVLRQFGILDNGYTGRNSQ